MWRTIQMFRKWCNILMQYIFAVLQMKLKICEYLWYMPGEMKIQTTFVSKQHFLSIRCPNSPQPLTVNVVHKRFKNFKAIYSSPSINRNKKYSKKDFLPPKIHKPVCFSRDKKYFLLQTCTHLLKFKNGS